MSSSRIAVKIEMKHEAYLSESLAHRRESTNVKCQIMLPTRRSVVKLMYHLRVWLTDAGTQ